MYFQLEVDYYSHEANKNKNTNFQLIATIKSNLKIAEGQIVLGIVLPMTACHTLLLGLESTLLLIEIIFFKCKLCLFEQGTSLSIFISV